MTTDLKAPPLELIATCAFGLEAIVRRELAALGYDGKVVSPGRVQFDGDYQAICRSNVWLRCADRVLVKVASFAAPDFDALFDTVRAIAWEDWLSVDAAFPVIGRSAKSTLTSVPAVQRSVKKAIVLRMQDAYRQSTLAETGAEYKIEIALLNDQATLTIDTTGPSLHKRGYRLRAGEAPIKETLAAAMVMLSFWKGDRPMIDPFVGSGTIPIEAALIARQMAPGRHRRFTATDWPQVAAHMWADTFEEADDLILPDLTDRIIGYDTDQRTLAGARHNAEAATVAGSIHFQCKDFADLTSARQYGCVITNPPYGERLGGEWELRPLYESIPSVLAKLPTWSHYLITAYPNFEALVGREADRRRKLYNGRIECTYYQFHGPKRPKRRPQAERQTQADSVTAQPSIAALLATTETIISGGHPIVVLPKTEIPDHSVSKTDTTDVALTPNETAVQIEQSIVPGVADSESTTESPPRANESVTTGTAPADETTTATDAQTSTPAIFNRPESDDAGIPAPTESDSETISDTQTAPIDQGTSFHPPTKLPPVFGHVESKTQQQAELFSRRLKKLAKHLRRYPTRQGITSYRIYERDVAEVPLVVDRYEDHLHLIEYDRPHDRNQTQHARWLDQMAITARETLGVEPGKVFLKHKRRQRGDAQHEQVNDQKMEVVVNEGGLKFLVNLSDYVDTGLFLDHRITRSMVRDDAKGKSFLNLFAYTGSFSVYAADGGAKETVTVDWSNTYLKWAERNMYLNKLDGPQHQFVRAGTMDFLRNHANEPTYDLVVVDPPTFSNSKRTEDIWDVQKSHVEMFDLLIPLVKPGGTIYFSNNFRRFKFDPNLVNVSQCYEISKQTVPPEFRNKRIHRCWKMTV